MIDILQGAGAAIGVMLAIMCVTCGVLWTACALCDLYETLTGRPICPPQRTDS